MGPRRKKTHQVTTPDASLSDETPQTNDAPAATTTENDDGKQQPGPSATPVTPTSQAAKRSSWYKSASWSKKANPVAAQATHESISVIKRTSTSESLSSSPKSSSSARFVHPSLHRSPKSIPTISSESINATGSIANADKPSFFSDNLTKPNASIKKTRVEGDGNGGDDKNKTTKELDNKIDKAQSTATPPPSTDLKSLAQQTQTTESEQSVPEAPLPPEPMQDASSGWWGWWSRPDGYTDHSKHLKPQDDDNAEASSTPLPATPEDEHFKLDGKTININDTMNSVRSVATNASTRSWFGLWSNEQNQKQDALDEEAPLVNDTSPEEPSTTENTTDPVNTPTKRASTQETIQDQGTPQNKSAGWAFWSRAQDGGESSTPNGTQRQVGELAVADTPSQSHPEAAQFNEQPKQKLDMSENNESTAKLDSSARNPSTTSLTPLTPSRDVAKTPESPKSLVDSKTAKPQPYTNLVIPTFDESYSPAYTPSYRERITTYVASTLRLIDSPVAAKHVSISTTAPKIRNAIAIGVHGYFPTPLIQKVLGQPTGTSIRFANHASNAIRDWVAANQPETTCEIETVALEGEGYIADRVSTLWKLMLNWLSHLRQADLILVACHSQGVPVAVMLVHKLLQLGCLSPHAKIGICAMAGVNLGPFADYKSRWLGTGAAAELFEFSRQDSRVSTEYKAALDGVLRHGVRITYCGSIDDQLVSLESSTLATLTHPYVYRAVFVDGRLHASNFLTHLVAFALKLRNLGVSDHGLIRELSPSLAGSLYGGEGHSRIYDDAAVYTLALRFVLETTDLPTPVSGAVPSTDSAARQRSSRGGPPDSVSAANSLRRGSISASSLPGIAPIMANYEIPASGSNANPYFLPWALRGIFEEEIVKTDMQDEVGDLIAEFEEWKPSSKILKDVRFRLEGVRSKL